MNPPSSTVISVTVDPDGSSDAGDELSVTFDGESSSTFEGSYEDFCTPPDEAPIISRGGATNVRVNFDGATDADAGGHGFTVRVIFFINDVCGTADAPHVITLDELCPVAALSSLNFPSMYDVSTCFTKVESPEGTEVVVDYKQFYTFFRQDPLYIFDENQCPPVLLRSHFFAQLSKTSAPFENFGTASKNIQLVFNPSETTQTNREGFLIVFTFREYDSSVILQPSSFCNEQGTPGKECSCPHEPGQPTCDLGTTDLNSLVGNPQEVCDPTTGAGGFRVDLDFTAAGSITYLANEGFIDMVPNVPSTFCRWRIVGPAGSNLFFQLVDYNGEADDVFSVFVDGFGLIFRFAGSQPEYDLPISVNGEQSVVDVRNPVLLPRNRATITFNFESTGFGISFAVRVVDTRCQPTCVNGGECVDTCNCNFGYLRPQCGTEVSISLVAVSASPVKEGSPMIIECRANGVLQTTTRIEFEVSTISTAIEGFDFDFINERPCIIPAGQSTGTVSILVIDDDHGDNEETVQFDVSEARGDITSLSAVTPNSISFMLCDDDDPTVRSVVEVDFESPKYFIVEGEEPAVTLTLVFTRDGEPTPVEDNGAIMATIIQQTATMTADYNWAGTPISYTASSGGVATLELTFQIEITSDEDEESIESFLVMLLFINNLFGASQLGTTLQTTTIYIIDDDQEDFILIVDKPYIDNKNANDPLKLFAFTNQNSPLPPFDWTKKFFDRHPVCTQSMLDVDGQMCGYELKCPQTNKLPGRRLGYYLACYSFEGGSQSIGTSVMLQNDCFTLNSRHTVTVYPDQSNPSLLDTKLHLRIRRIENCAPCSKMIWKRNGHVIPNRGSQYIASTVEEARGVFQVFRPYRANSGWFAMVEVIVSDCPRGMYKGSEGACDQTCPNCENGGVCELNGMCKCPPCFFGTLCQHFQCEEGSFGTNKRIQCSQLHPSYAGNKDCKGLLFCYGGLYACKCGCGWHGANCEKACPEGKFGADCELSCHCADQHDCDRISGVCSKGCADGFRGFNCQQTAMRG